MPQPITCRGWSVQRPVAEWSLDAAVFTTNVVVPAPSPTQIRVKVYAAGVNPMDWKRTTLKSKASFFSSRSKQQTGEALPFPYTMGLDGAGEVESIGSMVSAVGVGDRVAFHSDMSQSGSGSFCEYALAEADSVVLLPTTGRARPYISFEEAASIPCATYAAYVALFDKLRIEAGRSIFIDGASGGVGSSAVQLARHFGLFVIASCSPAYKEDVMRLGANVVLDYHSDVSITNILLDSTNGNGVDYMLEVASPSRVEDVAVAVRFGGSVCLLAGLLVPETSVLFRRQLSVHYVHLAGLHRHPLTRPQLRHIGEGVMRFYADGVLGVSMQVLPFEKASEAVDELRKGNRWGKSKLVLRVR